MQRLKAARLIAERRRRSFEPAVHVLTTRGIDLLDSRGELLGFPPLSRRAKQRTDELRVLRELTGDVEVLAIDRREAKRLRARRQALEAALA